MSHHPTKRRRHVARKWHRWLGLIAALPILWLSVSGIMLNHAERFGLDEKMVRSQWVLRHYNQLPEGEPAQIKIGDRRIYSWGEEKFLDHRLLALEGDLIGAVAWKGQLLIATDKVIGVFDGSDDLLLELDELSLPATPIQALEVKDDKVYLLADGRTYLLSEDFFSAEPASGEIQAISLQELSGEEKSALEKEIRTRRAMPLWRVITDAHSGRLFGWPGWVMNDLAAVSLIIITLLGLRLFPKRKP